MWQFWVGVFAGAVVGVFAAALLFVGRDGGPVWEEVPSTRTAADTPPDGFPAWAWKSTAAELPPGRFPECCHGASVAGCPSCEAFAATQA